MKKLTTFLISGLLLFGAAACNSKDVAKTSQAAPDSTQAPAKAPTVDTVKTDQNDAQSQTRRDQLNSDIRAHEQRNNATNGGSDAKRAESALATEVRDKLEANIPNGQITVEATKDGVVTVSGTVPYQAQLSKIEPLSRQIKGVKGVNVKAVVAKPQPKGQNSKTQ
jgi:hypothetical protein